MKKRAVAALLAALLTLAACVQEEPEEGGVRVWFPTDQKRDTRAQAVSNQAFDPDRTATVDALMAALLEGPAEDGLSDPFPAGTRLLGWELDGDLLLLDLSAPYGELTGVGLTLADCCITLTLCQLEGVDRVCITVDGAEVAGRERQILTPEDMIFTGAEEEPRQISATLYFPRAGRGLGFETRELTLTEDDDLYVTIAQTLLAGPEDSDLRAVLPEGVALRGAWVDDGICYVNFSAEFLTLAPEQLSEQNLLLYSVVDTLGNLNSVTAVQLLVEGELVEEFGGQETSLPLEPDFGPVNER